MTSAGLHIGYSFLTFSISLVFLDLEEEHDFGIGGDTITRHSFFPFPFHKYRIHRGSSATKHASTGTTIYNADHSAVTILQAFETHKYNGDSSISNAMSLEKKYKYSIIVNLRLRLRR